MTNQNLGLALKSFYVRYFSRKKTLSILLLISSIGAIAGTPVATKKEIGMFINSTTCIVLENEANPYNTFIKDAVEKYWKSTPFEFITETEFQVRRFDSKYSFLVLIKNVYDNDPGGVSYNYLSLVLGDKSTNMKKMPELCSIPLIYSNDNNLDYEYVIPALVKFVQIHAKNLEKNRFLIQLNGLSYYNSSGFKEKELLMNRDGMAPDSYSVDKINAVYPYFVKLLSANEILKEVSLNPKNTLFHFHVGPNQSNGVGKCFEMIFDVNGKLYYYSSRRITNENVDGFNMRDFRRIK